jgi:hypothetical protein
MKPFAFEIRRGKVTLVTAKGTPVLTGEPKVAIRKFGSYFTFVGKPIAAIERVITRNRVFHVFEVQDGSRARLFLQTKTNSNIKRGVWHVTASECTLA